MSWHERDSSSTDRLLAAITNNVIQSALGAEMTERLGNEKGDRTAAADTRARVEDLLQLQERYVEQLQLRLPEVV